MHDTGCLGLVHWDNPEGWNGEGGGRRVQDGEHMYKKKKKKKENRYSNNVMLVCSDYSVLFIQFK